MLKKTVSILAIVVPFIFSSNLNAQQPLAADQALEKLMQGNKRFIASKAKHPNQDSTRRHELKEAQEPFAAILGCADSRVPSHIVFDQGLGDLFVTQVAGNTPDDLIIGSLEFAATSLNVPLIVVLGHERCGAVQASLQKAPLPGHIEAIAKKIRPALKSKPCTKENQINCSIKANINHVVDKLKNSDPILAPLVNSGKLKIVGAEYELRSGEVKLMP